MTREEDVLRWDVLLTTSPGLLGGLPWFVCPLSGGRVRTLYFDGERLGGRKALGLAYSSQSRSQKTRLHDRKARVIEALSNPRLQLKRRQALIGLLEDLVAKLDVVDGYVLDALEALNEENEHLKAQRRRRHAGGHPPPMSTAAAITAGRRGRAKVLTSHAIGLHLRQQAKLQRQESLDALKAPLDELGAYPELDLRAFRLGQGVASGLRLLWPSGRGGPSVEILTYLDTKRSWLVVENFREATAPLQVINLLDGAHQKFFACPVTGKRCLKLYFREGRFASAEAQRLVPASVAARRAGIKTP
jgi:hypothetical protein